jgi:hypothetical protein
VKGIIYQSEDVNAAARELLARGMEAGLWDAVLVPARVPAADSYAWLLLRDAAALQNATPLPGAFQIGAPRDDRPGGGGAAPLRSARGGGAL